MHIPKVLICNFQKKNCLLVAKGWCEADWWNQDVICTIFAISGWRSSCCYLLLLCANVTDNLPNVSQSLVSHSSFFPLTVQLPAPDNSIKRRKCVSWCWFIGKGKTCWVSLSLFSYFSLVRKQIIWKQFELPGSALSKYPIPLFTACLLNCLILSSSLLDTSGSCSA